MFVKTIKTRNKKTPPKQLCSCKKPKSLMVSALMILILYWFMHFCWCQETVHLTSFLWWVLCLCYFFPSVVMGSLSSGFQAPSPGQEEAAEGISTSHKHGCDCKKRKRNAQCDCDSEQEEDDAILDTPRRQGWLKTNKSQISLSHQNLSYICFCLSSDCLFIFQTWAGRNWKAHPVTFIRLCFWMEKTATFASVLWDKSGTSTKCICAR